MSNLEGSPRLLSSVLCYTVFIYSTFIRSFRVLHRVIIRNFSVLHHATNLIRPSKGLVRSQTDPIRARRNALKFLPQRSTQKVPFAFNNFVGKNNSNFFARANCDPASSKGESPCDFGSWKRRVNSALPRGEDPHPEPAGSGVSRDDLRPRRAPAHARHSRIIVSFRLAR